ncbi:hypothetical protein OIU74_011353 [Salix koriyanagi]|uniref:Uncharacterized protein n=1 Tax=Salix koriyanagi TaxID=2511006 RepID=A0A9Q0TF29_9ROSI|nr:hypothetical protein OIU74_011353 [Salix koriyanagi]
METTLFLSHLFYIVTTFTVPPPSATPCSETLATPTCKTPSATTAQSRAFSIQKDGGSPNMGVNTSPKPYLKPNYGGGVRASGRVMRGSEEMGKKREMESMKEAGCGGTDIGR